MSIGGSSNPKWARTRYFSWRIIDLFAFLVSKEWFTGILDLGMRDLGSGIVKVGVQSKLPLEICVQECKSCLHDKKLLEESSL